MSTIKLIDTSTIEWRDGKNITTPINQMHQEHKMRVFLWLRQRLKNAQESLDLLPSVMHESALSHNGRELQEWIEIFKASLESDAETQMNERIVQIESALKELETQEQKRERLLKELETLKD